jgi:fumarate reductase flavoprotein subunit
MDYHAFLATLERYNGFVEKQHDDEFGRTTALRAPINEGPFHAIRIAPGVHHTMGGVTINTDTAVLNASHQVIAGAFAAGEVVGGIHGGNRIGGNAVADIIIFGTLAGHQAAKRARGLASPTPPRRAGKWGPAYLSEESDMSDNRVYSYSAVDGFAHPPQTLRSR